LETFIVFTEIKDSLLLNQPLLQFADIMDPLLTAAAMLSSYLGYKAAIYLIR